MAVDRIESVVTAVNTAKLDSLESMFSSELSAEVKETLALQASSVKNAKYTVSQTVTEDQLQGFTYTATGTSATTGKSGTWTGSVIVTVEGTQITDLQVHEDVIAKAIVLGESLHTVANPTATGTWVGAASGLTVTLKMTQSGKKITGSGTISGFKDPFPVTGENNYPAQPNVVINATVVGLPTEFEGGFDGPSTIDGTLKIDGFEHIQVAIKKQG